MRRKSESHKIHDRIMIPLTLGIVPGGLLTFILVDAFQPILVYLYFNRFMIPGKEVSMAGFVCIFIVLLKNLHAMMNFLAKMTNRCTKSTFLRHYQVISSLFLILLEILKEHYEALKYFGSHRILSPKIKPKVGYPISRKVLETMLASSNFLTSLLNLCVGLVLSTCNFVITGCILEFQMEELQPGFLESGENWFKITRTDRFFYLNR